MSADFQTSLILAWGHLRELEMQLSLSLADKRAIYLDLNHWINLREVVGCSEYAKPEYARILELLRSLRTDGRIFCPLSSPIVEELMNVPESRRNASAEVMDEISLGVCIRFSRNLACREWRSHVWKVVEPTSSRRRFPIWTRIAFWAGQDDQFKAASFWENTGIDPYEWLKWRWSRTTQEIAEEPFFTPMPTSLVKALVTNTNDSQERAAALRTTFEEYWSRQKLALLHAFKDDFFVEPLPPDVTSLPTSIFSSFVDSGDPWILPSLQVRAKIVAALMRSEKIVDPNDLLDYDHASAAIPHADAFFCDRRTAALLNSKDLDLGRVYQTKILWQPSEIIAYLESLS
jgi:hypothetical protein